MGEHADDAVDWMIDGKGTMFGAFSERRRSPVKRKQRFRCSCGHRTTPGLAKRNGGVCFSCKKPLSQFKVSAPE